MLNKNTVQPLVTFAVCIFCIGVVSSLELVSQDAIVSFIPIILGLMLIEAIVIKNKKSAKNKLHNSVHSLKYDSINIWERLVITQKTNLKPNINSLLEALTTDLANNSFETKNIPTLASIKNNHFTDSNKNEQVESQTLSNSTDQTHNIESKNSSWNQEGETKKSLQDESTTIQKKNLWSLIQDNLSKKINYSDQKLAIKISSVPKKNFKWSIFKPNLISLVVIIATIFGFAYNLKVSAVATPVVSLSVPASSRVGENFTFTAGFSNTGNTVGYGPFIDVMLPTAGIDGSVSAPFDGIDFISATYLGSPTTNTILTFPSSFAGANPCSAGQFPVLHPLAKDNTGAPLRVCGLPNDKLVVSQLPFGSYTPGQPMGNILYTVNTSSLADVGTPMTIRARAGFYLGNDSFVNPATDPSIVSVVSSANNTPTLFNVTKSYVGPEDETATGPNFPRTYIITADIAAGQTINNFRLTDNLPNNIVITGITNPSAAITSNITTFPYGPVNGGNVSAIFTAPVTGGTGTNDASFSVTFYVPELDANGQPVINPTTGSFVTSTNTGSGSGNWAPIDSRDGASVPVTSVSTPANQHILTDKSIATQKSVANLTDATLSPGDKLEYTINFQISDYFSFSNLIQNDKFSDGQRFDTTFAPSLTVTDRSGTTSGDFTVGTNALVDTSKIGNTPSNVDAASDGSTTMTFNVSQAMVALGAADGILQGGRAITPNSVGAVGTIKFRTIVQQKFSDAYDSVVNDAAVSLNDVLTNDTIISGRVLNNATLAEGPTRSDTSRTAIVITAGSLSKSIYAINGSTTFASPVVISANDTVTYRLQYTVPQSDVEMLKLVDYLPLPVFPVAPVSLTVDPTASATAPLANSIKFGPNHTFSPTGFVTPIVAKDSGSNSLWFDFGTRDDPLNRQSNIDILLSVRVSPDPIGDEALITNQVRSILGSTNQIEETADAIVQIKLTQPNLKITKGIIGDDNPSAVFVPTTTGPVTFIQPPTNSCPRFTGTINSTNLLTSPINSNLSNSDGGDTVRYAITVENTGNGVNGAFDVKLQDTLPSNLVNPTNLCVTLGDGTVLAPGTGYIINGSGLFDPTGGIEIVDPSVSQGGLAKKDPSNGKNIVIVSYDATVGPNAVPNQVLINTAKITNYTSQPAGPNYAMEAPNDTAQQVNIAPVKLNKTILSTDQVHTANNDVVIGEKIRYRLTITVPEGRIPQLKISDTLDAGLVFVDCIAITNNTPANVTTSLSGGFNTACNDPTNPTVTNSGRTLNFDLGTVTNANTNNAQLETIFVDYDVVVDNVASNVNGQLRNNSAVINWVDSSKTDQSGNTTSASAPDVTIKEPKLRVTKTATPNIGDAGDQITYTITLNHDTGSNATAFDANITDLLSTKLAFVPGSLAATGLAPTSLTESAGTISANFSSFPLGSTTTITFRANVLSNVQAAEIIGNAAPTKWTSLPTSVVTPLSPYSPTSVERTGDPANVGGTSNNYNTTSNADFTVTNLTPTKALVSTSEALTTGSNVNVGEVVRYRLAIGIPEGTTNGIRLVDNLPNGLTYLNDGSTKVAIVATTPSNIVNQLSLPAACLVSGNSNTISPNSTCTLNPTRITGGTFNSGTDPIFSLGNFTNNENDGDTEYVIVEFNAIVANETSNQAFDNATGTTTPTTLGNTFETFINTSTQLTTSNNIDITVVEPVIRNLTKTITKTPTDAGDEINYTLTFSNTGNAVAFNTKLTDVLNSNLDLINPTTTGLVITKPAGTTVINTSTNSNVDLEFDQLLPTESVTVVIKAFVKNTAPSGLIIPNVANLTYTSLPGTNGTATNPTGSLAAGTPGTVNGERVGATGTNDYTATANISTTLSKPTVDKKSPTLTTYTIGDEPEFDILVTLPEGETKGLIIRDTLPTGLSYISNQVVTSGSGLTSPYSGTVITPTVTNTGNVYSFNLGDQITPATTVTTANSFILRVKARVDNILSNQQNTVLTNTGSLQFLNGATNETVNDPTPATITVTEPVLSLSKVISNTPTNPDAGDIIEYTANIKHATGSGATARDVIWSDTLPTGLGSPVCVSVTIIGTTNPNLGCSNFTNSGNNISLSSFDLPVGSEVSVKYTTAVSNNVGFNQVLTNDNKVKWTTQSGVNVNERTGADGIFGTVGILNDYSLQTSASFNITTQGSISKALVATDSPATTGNNLTIGETATYELTVNLQEGQANNVIVSDLIPAGMQYVAGSVQVDTTGFNGVINTPTVTGNTDFNFSNVLVNGDNITSNNSFKIRLQVKVLDIISNSGLAPATTHSNIARLNVNNNLIVDSNTVTTTVVEPRLTLTKDIVQTTANVGDDITINLTVTNTGTSEAFDIVLDDPLATSKFSNITNLTSNMNNFSFSLVPTGSNTIVRFSGGSVPVGATYTFSFKATLLTNSA